MSTLDIIPSSKLEDFEDQVFYSIKFDCELGFTDLLFNYYMSPEVIGHVLTILVMEGFYLFRRKGEEVAPAFRGLYEAFLGQPYFFTCPTTHPGYIFLMSSSVGVFPVNDGVQF